MNPTKDDIIDYRINRALETIAEAKLLASQNCWNTTVNRLYYACFYIILALFLKKGIKAISHAGVKTMFQLHFIKTGLIERKWSKFYNKLFDQRNDGDYSDMVYFDEETVNELIPLTEEFVSVIKQFISELNQEIA